jgi:sec-independent protein translocase protein TatB
MLGLGWGEMLVLATIAILVVGPKDLPKMLRGMGRTVRSIKTMAGDFQRQFSEALDDIDDDGNVTKGGLNPLKGIKDEINSVKEDFDLSWMDNEKVHEPAANAQARRQALKDAAGEPDPAMQSKPATAAKPKASAKAPTKAVSAKKPAARKPAAKKPAAKKPAARKAAAKKPTDSKTVAKKPVAKKSPAKKTAAKSTAKKAGETA